MALTILLLISAGCTSARTKANPNEVAGFQPGVTTLDQVEARLGQPYSVSRTADASTIIAYRSTCSHIDIIGYIPIVGAFEGDSDANMDVVVLSFDKESKFVSSTLTQSTSLAGLFSQN